MRKDRYDPLIFSHQVCFESDVVKYKREMNVILFRKGFISVSLVRIWSWSFFFLKIAEDQFYNLYIYIIYMYIFVNMSRGYHRCRFTWLFIRLNYKISKKTMLYLNFPLFIRQIYNKLKSHNQIYTLKKENLIKYCSSVARKKTIWKAKYLFSWKLE